jgi:hypothetical protein
VKRLWIAGAIVALGCGAGSGDDGISGASAAGGAAGSGASGDRSVGTAGDTMQAAGSAGAPGSNRDASTTREDGAGMGAHEGDARASAPAETGEAAPPHVVGTCSDLPAKGVWQETTPAEVKAKFAKQQYGVIALAVNPQNPAIVYFGTHQIGIWKSTDCGASFVHVDTGENGAVIDGGFQWSVAIDPVTPDVLYANSGYSSSSGAWKSINGGVDWKQLWPPADATLAKVVDYNFVHKIRIDPLDHQHLLISFHAACNAPYHSACIAESHDGGSTWQMVNGDASWTGGEDQTVWFLDDSRTWLYASQSNGMWRTSDGGASWKVIDPRWGGHNGGQLFRAEDGAFYHAGPAGLLRSRDGVSWSQIPSVGTGLIGITGDGTSLYASHGPYAQEVPYLPYDTALESNGSSWMPWTSPKLSTGGYELGYDPDHHLLYSTNATAGFYRVVTE